MTTNKSIKETLGTKIEESYVGNDNAFSPSEGISMAEELLGHFLVTEKSTLPEANHMDLMIYAGTQAVSTSAKPEEVLEKALSFLAIAAKLTELQAAKEEARLKEEAELLAIVNSLVTHPKGDIKTYSGLTETEKAAAREIRNLRKQVANPPLAW
jgi:hypothetical protein